MAKRKAKKKSPPSSRPPPACPSVSGPSSPTKKLARLSSLPTQASEVVIAQQLSGPNWLPELSSVLSAPGLAASGPFLAAPPGLAAAASPQLAASGVRPSLPALGLQGVVQDPPSASPHPPGPQMPISEHSPTLSELFAPIDIDIPGDSDSDGSSAYHSDSSSHYGSPVLANLESLACHPSPASDVAEGHSPQVGLVSAQGHPPSAQAAAHGLNAPAPSDQAPALGSDAPAPSSPPSGQWRNLFSSNRSSSSCPKLHHFVDISAAKTFNMVEDDIDVACDIWKLCLIGYVAGKFPGVQALRNIISSSWNCVAKMQIHDSGWIIYKFQSELEKLNVLHGGPYLIYGRPLMLKEMPEYFDFNSTEMTTLPVWVKLPNLPLKCWSSSCLSKIASALGKPVQCDMLTSSMTRLSYARILVEINLAEGLPQFVKFGLPNGVMHAQPIVYETLPKFCAHCKVIGHIVDSCSKIPKKDGGGNSQVKASSVLRNSNPAENDGLHSEGDVSLPSSVDLASSLVDVGLQDNASLATGMAFEAPAPAVALARQLVPKQPSNNKQPAPMISVATTDCVWQPVPKKHTSNRKGKSVAEVGNASGDTALSGLGGNDAGSAGVMDSVGSAGPLVGVEPQASGAAGLGLGLIPGSKGVLGGFPLASQRANGRARPLKALGQGGHTGKGLQSNSQLSRGHGRNLPTTTAP
ncbi:hypothetical protein OIU76_026564 [Salix suchowensis]|nr:hypothetical protein OIU76_026564 [Salix suchowensis]